MKRFALLLACLMALSVLGAVPAAAADFALITEETADGPAVTGYEGTMPSVLRIPDGIQAVGPEAFQECEELEEVIFPDGLQTIGEGAFLNCSALREITWPDTLKSIGIGAFSGTAIQCLELPDGLEQLGLGAFSGSTELTSVSFPSGLHTIGGTSFRGCTALTDVRIPEGVVYVGAFAFADCTALASISLPSTILSVQDGAFKGCTALTDVVIPEGPTYLSYTFADCSELESVSIPASVVQIEGHVFSKCFKLKTLRYGGTKEAWEKALTYGDTTVRSDVELIFGDQQPGPVPGRPAWDPDGAWDGPVLREDSGYVIRLTEDGAVLDGIEIGRGSVYTAALDVAAAFVVPEGASVAVLAEGEAFDPGKPIGTGDQIDLQAPGGEVRQITVVVPGDLLGTGLLDVAQLVRLAQALSGEAPLTGPYLEAACLTGGSAPTAGDLVRLARMLTSA